MPTAAIVGLLFVISWVRVFNHKALRRSKRCLGERPPSSSTAAQMTSSWASLAEVRWSFRVHVLRAGIGGQWVGSVEGCVLVSLLTVRARCLRCERSGILLDNDRATTEDSILGAAVREVLEVVKQVVKVFIRTLCIHTQGQQPPDQIILPTVPDVAVAALHRPCAQLHHIEER